MFSGSIKYDKPLLVDDNQLNLKVLERLLTQKLKHKPEQIKVANDGVSALKKIIPMFSLNDEVIRSIMDELNDKFDSKYKTMTINDIIDDLKKTTKFDNINISKFYIKSFSFIIMDDQMPNMRGAVATIIIRIYERLLLSKPNVIIAFSDSFKDDSGNIIPFPGANIATQKPPSEQTLKNSIAQINRSNSGESHTNQKLLLSPTCRKFS